MENNSLFQDVVLKHFDQDDATMKTESKQDMNDFSNDNLIDIPSVNGGYRSNVNVNICKPKSFNDVERVIGYLKEGKPSIVYLNKLKAQDCQRVLDMLSGAAYALNGGLYEIEQDIFMLTAGGMNILVPKK